MVQESYCLAGVSSPIMEVGPTEMSFWNAPRPPAYDDALIALWRLYARLHERLEFGSQLAKDLIDPERRTCLIYSFSVCSIPRQSSSSFMTPGRRSR